MGRARFLIYPWFIFFIYLFIFLSCLWAEPNFSRPEFELRNFNMLFINRTGI